jgi:hypothetical protein
MPRISDIVSGYIVKLFACYVGNNTIYHLSCQDFVKSYTAQIYYRELRILALESGSSIFDRFQRPQFFHDLPKLLPQAAAVEMRLQIGTTAVAHPAAQF